MDPSKDWWVVVLSNEELYCEIEAIAGLGNVMGNEREVIKYVFNIAGGRGYDGSCNLMREV